MSPTVIVIIGIIVLLVLMFMGMNVGAVMFFVGFVGYAMITNLDAAIGILRTAPMAQAMKYSFTVIPLFTFMGNACFAAGLSEGLYDASRKWLSRVPGAIACATVLASTVFGAICGSSTATASTIGTISLPELRKNHYDDKLSTGVIAASGGLGILIPPSTTMIVYGTSTELSIQMQFFAGLMTGMRLAVLFMVTIWVWMAVNPSLAPRGEKCSWRERFRSLKGVVGIVCIFLVTLGGMFFGFFTVNEAAAVGAFLSLIAMAVRKKFTLKNLEFVLKSTLKTSAMIFLLLLGATVFGNFLMISRLPTTFASFVSGLNVSRYLILAVIFIIYAFLGCLMDAVPMMLITLPIFYPVIQGLGFDGIWFGVFMVLVVNLGFVTPPVGMNCYVVNGLAKDVGLPTIFKGVTPFIIAILAAIVLCTVFPSLATWLPTVMKG
ncbi:MAG: TRAP transporter large permease [Oscillospiraceae bacterium]|nr:TRAP transporter large permease [Oscillospiraceae bacterium]